MISFIQTSVQERAKCIAFSLLLVLGLFVPAGGADSTATMRTDSVRKIHQTKHLRDRYKIDDPWISALLGIPFRIIHIPLDLFLYGVEKGVAVYDESKIGPRIQDLLNSDDGLRTVSPIYSSRHGAGLEFTVREILDPSFILKCSGSLGRENRHHVQAQLFDLWSKDGPPRFLLNVDYQNLTSERFYGIGPETLEGHRTYYAHARALMETGVQTGGSVPLTTRAGWSRHYVHDHDEEDMDDDELPISSRFSNETAPGLDDWISMLHLKVSGRYDSRDHLANPTRGQTLYVRSLWSGQIGARDTFGFYRFDLDLTQYLHLFYSRVLVLRLAGSITRPLSGRTIPFYQLSELGEDDTIRGFPRGRFRGRDRVYGSVEYRYPVHHRIDALWFVDAGQVAHDIRQDVHQDNLQVTWGGGFRIRNNDDEFLASLQIGFSSKGYRILFKLN